MSKRKTKKEKCLAEEKMKKKAQIKELKDLKAKLELKLIEQKKEKFKELNIRNLKIFGYSCNLLSPYVISLGLTIGIFRLCGGGYPFHSDELTKYKVYNLDYQSGGYVTMNYEYKGNGLFDKSLPKNQLVVYTPWELQDAKYVRIKRTYDVDKITTLQLYDAVLEENYDYINEHLIEFKEEKQTSNMIDDDSFNSFYFEASLHMFDKKDFIQFNESDMRNIIITIIELVIGFGIGGLVAYTRDFEFFWEIKYVDVDYKCCVKAIRKTETELREINDKIFTLTRNKVGGNSNER